MAEGREVGTYVCAREGYTGTEDGLLSLPLSWLRCVWGCECRSKLEFAWIGVRFSSDDLRGGDGSKDVAGDE